LHRRENHGATMGRHLPGHHQIVQERDVEVVFPLHKSPAVRDVVLPRLQHTDGVMLSEPLDYFSLVQTLASCDLVLTDSGGLQEEAPTLGKPVLVLRDTTDAPRPSKPVSRSSSAPPQPTSNDTRYDCSTTPTHTKLWHASATPSVTDTPANESSPTS
jgi:hypothetical protein